MKNKKQKKGKRKKNDNHFDKLDTKLLTRRKKKKNKQLDFYSDEIR